MYIIVSFLIEPKTIILILTHLTWYLSPNFQDLRTDYIQNEVALDYNAGFHGALAGIAHLEAAGKMPATNNKCPCWLDMSKEAIAFCFSLIGWHTKFMMIAQKQLYSTSFWLAEIQMLDADWLIYKTIQCKSRIQKLILDTWICFDFDMMFALLLSHSVFVILLMSSGASGLDQISENKPKQIEKIIYKRNSFFFVFS